MYNLNALEARILGVLIEKEATTPDQYPLTLNSLVLGCNQKTNRDPVLSLEESQVQETLDQLEKKGLIMESRVGSRVSKYKHRFCNTEFSELRLNKQEIAVICVMLLRGPQTPGELRTRTNRMCEFNDVTDVETVLENLAEKDGGPYTRKLEREPGKRESRYLQLFCDESITETYTSLSSSNADAALQASVAINSTQQERIEQLEAKVQALEEEMAMLKTKLADLL